MTQARAFTLLETVLATVIAGIVVLAVGSLYATLAVSDRTSTAALGRASELSMTQGAARRTFLRLVTASDREVDEDEDLPRPRLLLEPDPAADGAPRFEVVVSSPPVSPALATTVAEAAFALQDDASLNFVSADGSGGQERAVYELRPDGERERVMTRLGLESHWWDAPEDDPRDAARRGPRYDIRNASLTGGGTPGTTWTLWYRRMTPEEVALLEQGAAPWADGSQDDESEARRLAGAVRLATGLTEARWRVFKGGEWITEYRALMTQDLPAFLQLRVRAETGEYGEWLFEVAWTESERVGTDDDATFLSGDGGTDAGGDAGNPDTPGDDQTQDQNGRPNRGDSRGDDDRSLPTADGDSASGGTSVNIRRPDQ